MVCLDFRGGHRWCFQRFSHLVPQISDGWWWSRLTNDRFWTFFFCQLSWLDHLEGRHVFWLPDSLEFEKWHGKSTEKSSWWGPEKKNWFQNFNFKIWMAWMPHRLKKLIISGSFHLPCFLFEMNDHHCLQPDFFGEMFDPYHRRGI